MYALTWILYIFLALISVLMIRHCFISNSYRLMIGNKKLLSINISLTALYVILLLFAVLRKIEDGIGGADAYAYLQMLDNSASTYGSYLNSIRTKKLLSISEPIFQLFLIFCRQFKYSHAVFLLIIYSSILYNFLYFIKKIYKKEFNFFPIILIICSYLSGFNIIRSCWSASICLLAFCFILDKRYIKAFILIFIASFIHYMGFCFFIVWAGCLLYDKKAQLFNRKNLFIICILANLLTYGMKAVIFGFISNTKYSTYTALSSTVSLLGYLPTVLICAYSIWNFNYYKECDTQTAKCAVAMTINLSLIEAITGLVAWRMNDYFAIIRMYMLSNFFFIFKRKINKTIFTIVLYLFTIVLFIQQMISLMESSKVFPYEFFFV